MARIVSSGKTLHSSEFHEKKRKEKRIRWGLYLFFIIVVLALLVTFFRWEKFRVSHIEVTETSVVAVEDVERVVQSVLDEYYLWLIPKDNNLLIPRRAIKKALLQELLRIKSVNLELSNTNLLIIEIEERVPSAFYCKDREILPEAQNCYFLDENGFIFAQAPTFSGEVYFIYTGGEVSESPLGENFIHSNTFVGLTRFIQSLRELDIKVKLFEHIRETSENKSQYRLYLSDATPIFWYADEDLELVRSNLEILISLDIFKSKNLPLDNIEYLDLTIPNKPYWKNKEI